MSDDVIRTGLWRNGPGRPAGYSGKITLPDGSEYWINVYKNDRKETERHPDLHAVLKRNGDVPAGAAPVRAPAKPTPTAADPDDGIPF